MFQSANEAKRIFLVSPPRSGHHMIAGWLGQALGREYAYCEFYECIDELDRLVPCEAHSWPRQFKIGCRSNRRFQKNHDFDLDLPIADNFRYVITIRHPAYALSSWWAFEDRRWPGQRGNLRDWMVGHVEYWKRFVEKWYLPGSKENILVTRYEDITVDPAIMRRVLPFCNGDIHPTTNGLWTKEFLAKEVHPARDLQAEPHFDRAAYSEVQEMIGADFLAKLGYKALAS